jgi:hypothetical protein
MATGSSQMVAKTRGSIRFEKVAMGRGSLSIDYNHKSQLNNIKFTQRILRVFEK